MKLLLTSAGLESKKVADFFVSILPKGPVETTVVLFSSAGAAEQIYVDKTRQELLNVGVRKIRSFNLRSDSLDDLRGDFDVVYVNGGNTFEILDHLRNLKIDRYLKQGVKAGKLYFGVSAGSIIAGPSIESAGEGSEGDRNNIGLIDLKGLELTNIVIVPHFRPELKQEVEKFRAKVDYPVIELTDEEAVFIDESGYKII